MLWHLFILPWTIDWRKYDFAILPAGNRRLMSRCRKFTIAVVHDLSQYHVEQKYDCFRMFYCRRILPFFLKRINRVVAVSGSTAGDLVKYWKIPASRISVNYNGYDRTCFSPATGEADDETKALLKRLGINKKYIFYVSRIEHPGKNHLALIKAYEKLPQAIRDEYDLVLGGSFWLGGEVVREYAEKSPDTANIKFIGFIPHEELAPLYRQAAMYIFPSLFEGFGLSLLEAMACGIPVACSSTSSLGEIAADAAVCFDPENVDDMASAMYEILSKPELRKQLVEKGLKRLDDFDWRKHADKLISIYERSNGVLPRKNCLDCCAKFFEALLSFGGCLVFALPLWFYTACRRVFMGKKMFYCDRIYGKDERVLKIRYFNLQNPVFSKATLFYYVMLFKLRLVGVSIRKYPGEYREIGDLDLFMDSPGIFSLWFLRMSRGIAYSGRLETELRYVTERTQAGDIMILLRTLPAVIFFNSAKEFIPRIRLLDVEFDNIDMKEVLAAFSRDIAEGKKKKVYFVNADCFNIAANNADYLEILRKGDYILPDGIGMLLACKMLQVGLKENVNGTDMLPFLCRMASNNKYSIFLFGANPGVAEVMCEKLRESFPAIRIVGTCDGFVLGKAAETELIANIKRLKPDILLVALGAPLQEQWIDEHAGELPCHLMIGVGGLFDFYSGNIRRAPIWMRELGMEWFFRFLMEPRKRFKRYFLGNPLFLWRVRKWIKAQEKSAENK
jgi:exopolysaccharide biosynthesis WecB/TagA/CpsF family protein